MIKINLPDDTTINLLPCPQAELGKFRALLLEIQTAWVMNGLSVGDVVIDKKVWAKMKKAIAMLPRADSPGTKWSDLDAISNDYEQLSRLFFCDGQPTKSNDIWQIDSAKIVPAVLVTAHYFAPRRFLMECLGKGERQIDKTELDLALVSISNYLALLEASSES